MANNIIVQFSETEFRNLLKNCITESLQEKEADNIKDDKCKIFTINEAAQYLNLARQTLYGFTSNRTIPFIKKGKKLYFKKSDLEKWLSDGRKKTLDELNADING